MYCIEGKIDVREKPESYMGKFGFHHIDAATIEMPFSGTYSHYDVTVRTGDEEFVTSEHERLVEEGDIGAASRIEYIATEEDAEKYLKEAILPFLIAKKSFEKLKAEFDVCLPDDLDVLSGSAQLWEEKRRPTRRFYRTARGVLLQEVEFTPAHGWMTVDQELQGERTAKGIFTPFAHRAEVVTEIQRTQSRPGYHKEHNEKSTQRISGYSVRLSLGWHGNKAANQ